MHAHPQMNLHLDVYLHLKMHLHSQKHLHREVYSQSFRRHAASETAGTQDADFRQMQTTPPPR